MLLAAERDAHARFWAVLPMGVISSAHFFELKGVSLWMWASACMDLRECFRDSICADALSAGRVIGVSHVVVVGSGQVLSILSA